MGSVTKKTERPARIFFPLLERAKVLFVPSDACGGLSLRHSPLGVRFCYIRGGLLYSPLLLPSSPLPSPLLFLPPPFTSSLFLLLSLFGFLSLFRYFLAPRRQQILYSCRNEGKKAAPLSSLQNQARVRALCGVM